MPEKKDYVRNSVFIKSQIKSNKHIECSPGQVDRHQRLLLFLYLNDFRSNNSHHEAIFLTSSRLNKFNCFKPPKFAVSNRFGE
jgi:hypothetical protein